MEHILEQAIRVILRLQQASLGLLDKQPNRLQNHDCGNASRL